MTEKKKPAHEIKMANLKATIWKNGTDEAPRYNVTFERIYRLKPEDREEGDSGWRTSESFGRDDLLLLAKIADEAHSWVLQ